MVSSLTSIGQTIALECEGNPIKLRGSNTLLPRLQQMIDSWEKADPPTVKMLPVEANIPEHVAFAATLPGATLLDKAIGDLMLIAFYYLLRIGEYTCKTTRNNSKQMIQFKFEDVTFLKWTIHSDLRCLP
jgi:hypothetical protein